MARPRWRHKHAGRAAELPSTKKVTHDPKYRLEWLVNNKEPHRILARGKTKKALSLGAGRRTSRPILNRHTRAYSILRQRLYKQGKTPQQVGGLVRMHLMDSVYVQRMRKIRPLLAKGLNYRSIGIIIARREERKKPYSRWTIGYTIKWFKVHHERLLRERKVSW